MNNILILKSRKTIVVAVLVIISIITVVGCFVFKKTQYVAVNGNPPKIDLSDPIFDKTTNIGNTGIVVEYPSKGFYNLGVAVNPVDVFKGIAGIKIGSSINSGVNGSSQLIEMVVSIFEKNNKKTVKDFLSYIPSDSPEGKAVKNGYYITVGSNEFFVYKIVGAYDQGSDNTWVGATINKDKVIVLSFGYHVTNEAQDVVLDKHNEKLFLESLKHIKF